jgi:predicted TIM-barrel fold metal-dependent hydrolase
MPGASPNLRADTSGGSGHNALTRDPGFGLEFVDEFQDQLMFGTDSCQRNDVNGAYPNVMFIKSLRRERELSESALEKTEWRNAVQLLRLDVGFHE